MAERSNNRRSALHRDTAARSLRHAELVICAAAQRRCASPAMPSTSSPDRAQERSRRAHQRIPQSSAASEKATGQRYDRILARDRRRVRYSCGSQIPKRPSVFECRVAYESLSVCPKRDCVRNRRRRGIVPSQRYAPFSPAAQHHQLASSAVVILPVIPLKTLGFPGSWRAVAAAGDGLHRLEECAATAQRSRDCY